MKLLRLCIALVLMALMIPAFAGGVSVLGGQENSATTSNDSNALQVQADLTRLAPVDLSVAYLNEGKQDNVSRQGVAALAAYTFARVSILSFSAHAGPYLMNTALDNASTTTTTGKKSSTSSTTGNVGEGWNLGVLAGVGVSARLLRNLDAVAQYHHVFTFQNATRSDADIYLIGARLGF